MDIEVQRGSGKVCVLCLLLLCDIFVFTPIFRLFFGGFHYMKIESVRSRPTKQNFKDIIYALQYLDTLITGGQQEVIKLSANQISVIKTLFDNILGKITMTTLDTYICDTFEAFRNNKKQIVLDLWSLEYANKEILDLIMFPLKKRRISVIL